MSQVTKCRRMLLIVLLMNVTVLITHNWFMFNQLYSVDLRSIEKEMVHSQQFNSTCSWEADQRGPHQKIIGYSIYGELSKHKQRAIRYLSCLKETLRIIPKAYPGWIVRIHHNLMRDDQEGLKILKNILPPNYKDYIDLCNATDVIKRRKLNDLFPMTWRWMPLLDEMVDVLMSRDTDSPLLPREEAAVREWLESSFTFHIMRDHPSHCFPMLGGLWGVKINQNRTVINKIAEEMLIKIPHLHYYGHDQGLLATEMWRTASTDMMAHDSFCCPAYRPNRPFPTQRDGNKYVGMAVGKGCGADMVFKEKLPECPERCRPKNHSADWIYC